MIHLITYGNEKYRRKRQELIKNAVTLGWFNTVTEYSPEKLEPIFKNRFSNILKQERGAGYWIWKINIIKQKLAQINDNDIMLYLDAGCDFNPKGNKRFQQYIDFLRNSNKCIISFELPFIEKKYTTKEIFTYFNISETDEIVSTGQYVGGVLFMKKTAELRKLLDLWEKTLNDDPLLFTDYYTTYRQASYFIDNRHDQSIFGIIRKMHPEHSVVIPDETYFADFNSKKALESPIWALRNKTSNEKLNLNSKKMKFNFNRTKAMSMPSTAKAMSMPSTTKNQSKFKLNKY